jgi:hypothetical protein
MLKSRLAAWARRDQWTLPVTDEPENLTLALLRKIDRKVDAVDAKVDALRDELRSEIVETRAELRSEMHSLRADVASDMMDLEKRLSDQIVGLRRAVVEYHSSVVGHGVLLSELEERLRRVERHVGLASETHWVQVPRSLRAGVSVA